MASIADGLDFLIDLVMGRSSSGVKAFGGVDHGGLKCASALIAMVFVFMWLTVWHKVSQKDFSTIVTAAAALQCFGFLLLALRVRATKSVAGISSRTLQMFVLYLSLRLCSTTLKKGYIPVDRSGHYFYQLMDFSTVALASYLVFCCHKTYRHSYQEEHDTLPISPFIPPAVILACFVHGNLNRSFFFDTVWFASLNLETVVLLPQLWMMSKIGGKVNGVSAEFVACQVFSKVMTMTFWMWAHTELKTKDGWNVVGWQICGAYMVQLILSADFMFYYVKGFLEGSEAIVLPQQGELEM